MCISIEPRKLVKNIMQHRLLVQEKKTNLFCNPYLFIFFRNFHNDYETSYSCDESKNDNKEVNDVMPRGAAEENFWCQHDYAKNYLKIYLNLSFLKVDLNHLDYEIYRYQKVDMTNDDANRMSRAADCNLGHD